MTLSELALALGADLRGSTGDEPISGIAGIEQAVRGQVTFIANKRYTAHAKSTRASAILVEPDFPDSAVPTLRIANPYLAFAHAVALFYEPPLQDAGIHPTAVIHPTARIGSHPSIGPYVVVGQNAVIGEGATLHPHVVIYPHVVVGDGFTAHAHAVVREYCRLGDRVTLQNGAVIGADGFGFARTGNPTSGSAWQKITQSGPAVLEDDVEVQANSCIDGASIGETRIGRGAKIDNLVQVGHGSTVGADTLLCAQVGLAGSTVVGRGVTLAGQVGVAGHCTIGDGAIATAQSGIPNDVAPGKIVSGYPAVDNRQWLRSVALFNRLPELLGRRKRPE